MNIRQFKYGEGNLSYLISDQDKAAAIDGGAVDEILQVLDEQSFELEFVLNTHDHADHTPGNDALLKATAAEHISTTDLAAAKGIKLGKGTIAVLPAPGHTMDSIVFSCNDWLVTGDTLFNGTVGNCYSGNYEIYFESLESILRFPPNTRVFAGHDLVDYALGVAENIDPDNRYLNDYRQAYDPLHVVSTLQMELNVNPFIRHNDSTLDPFRDTLGMPLSTPFEKWRAMMTVH